MKIKEELILSLMREKIVQILIQYGHSFKLSREIADKILVEISTASKELAK